MQENKRKKRSGDLVLFVLCLLFIFKAVEINLTVYRNSLSTLVKSSASVVRAADIVEVNEKEVPPPVPPKVFSSVVGIIAEVFGQDADRAVRVAIAESGLNPNAKNPNSSATGVYQIIQGTWKLMKCEGERTDPYANTVCAKKIFDHEGGRFNTSFGWSASFQKHGQY